LWLGQSTLKHVKDAVQVSTGWSQADSQIQSTLLPQAHTRVWICTHCPLSWSPGEGREGFPKSCLCGKNEPTDRADTCLGCGSLPVKGFVVRGTHSLQSELQYFPSCILLPLYQFCPHTCMHMFRVTQVGLDCEGNSQCHELP